MGQDAPRDVDESARQRERVDDGVIHEAKRPRQIGPLRQCGQPHPEPADVALERSVGIEAVLPGDLRVRLAPHGDLLTFADQHELPPTGGGVDGAGREEQQTAEVVTHTTIVRRGIRVRYRWWRAVSASSAT